VAVKNRQAYVANRIDLVWDDVARVGAVQNAEVQISFALEPISGVGSVRVLEYIPTMARITVNTDMVYMFGEEVERVGASYMPQKSDDSLNGMVFDMYALVDAVDTPSRYGKGNGAKYNTMWKAQGCFLDSGSFRVAKHGAIGRACSFAALDYKLSDNSSSYDPPEDRGIG